MSDIPRGLVSGESYVFGDHLIDRVIAEGNTIICVHDKACFACNVMRGVTFIVEDGAWLLDSITQLEAE
mgnify:CR=1 FL=1